VNYQIMICKSNACYLSGTTFDTTVPNGFEQNDCDNEASLPLAMVVITELGGLIP